MQRPFRAVARRAERAFRGRAVAAKRGPRIGLHDSFLHQGGGAAARKALVEERALADAPLRRAAPAEIAVSFNESIDARLRVVAKARRIEARKLELGAEAQRLAEMNSRAAARFGVARARAQRAHLDVVAPALGIRGERHVVLRECALDALRG